MELMMGELAGFSIELTTDVNRFSYHTGPKLNYSQSQFNDEPFIYASGLLFEKRIKKQDIAVFDWADTKAFFATHPKYILPFDPFAAGFYLVSRYEEYLPFRHDKHDRFESTESLAFQKNFLQKPLVNIYARQMRKIMTDHFPGLTYKAGKYRFINTVDIDNAWAYKEKGILRIGGALLRSLVSLKFSEVAERMAVLLEQKKDPYDTYDHLFEMQKKYSLDSIYFFLVGDYGENDKNVPISNRNFQSLIKSISDYCDVGLHPSYSSASATQKVKLEQNRLYKIIHKEVTKSRQHFLRLTIPYTYRQLLDCDITDDYTMGFSGEIGFRAGICSPFIFYDLETESITKLRIHPFMVMDATLRYYMKIQPAEVMSYVGPIIKEVKAVDGTFISLWHNESLTDRAPWEGWKNVYEDIIKAAVK